MDRKRPRRLHRPDNALEPTGPAWPQRTKGVVAVSERCEKCKTDMGFPCSREVLIKSRNCPSCGHTQRVEKSILYVVETLEEQVEWLSERMYALEGIAGVVVRPKPQPVPKVPVIHPSLPEIDLFGDYAAPAALLTTVTEDFALKDLI